MKKKVIIGIAITLVIIIVVVSVIIQQTNKKKEDNIPKNNEKENVEIKDNGVEQNISKKLHETKLFEGLEIKEIKLERKNDETVLEAKIENKTGNVNGDFDININVKDKDGNIVKKISGYINAVNPSQSTSLKTITTYDFVNAYDIEFVKI